MVRLTCGKVAMSEAISLKEDCLPKVRLHATAVFVILNHFVRRSDKEARVLGK